jgi:hypothetical protein
VERLVDLARERVEPRRIVDAHPDRAEEVERPARRLHRLLEVLALEPEVRRTLGRDRSHDLEREVDREHRALQRHLVADLPAVLLERAFTHYRAVAPALELLELLLRDLVIGPRLGDRIGLDREVRERDTVLLAKHAAEPRPARHRDHARHRAYLLQVGIGQRIDEARLVVHDDARVGGDLLEDPVHAVGHRREEADQRDRERDRAAGQQAAQLVAREVAP